MNLDRSRETATLIDIPSLTNAEQVEQIQEELEKVRNRVAVVKAFYHHLHLAQLPAVRRELENKVEVENSIIDASLSNISNIISKWTQSDEKNVEAERKCSALVREVARDYDAEIARHKTHLQNKLKDASLDSTLHSVDAEERYALILKAGNAQHRLRSLFPFLELYPNSEETETVDLHLIEFPQQTAAPSVRMRITVCLLSTVLTFLLILAIISFI